MDMFRSFILVGPDLQPDYVFMVIKNDCQVFIASSILNYETIMFC